MNSTGLSNMDMTCSRRECLKVRTGLPLPDEVLFGSPSRTYTSPSMYKYTARTALQWLRGRGKARMATLSAKFPSIQIIPYPMRTMIITSTHMHPWASTIL